MECSRNWRCRSSSARRSASCRRQCSSSLEILTARFCSMIRLWRSTRFMRNWCSSAALSVSNRRASDWKPGVPSPMLVSIEDGVNSYLWKPPVRCRAP